MPNVWDHASILDLLQRRQTLPPFIPPSQNPQLTMFMHPVAQAMAQAGQTAPAPVVPGTAPSAPAPIPPDATLGQLASLMFDGSTPGGMGTVGGGAPGVGSGISGGGGGTAAP